MGAQEIKVGHVVLASMTDPQGLNPKERPAMVANVGEDGSILVIAITSKHNEENPFVVGGLPWSSGPIPAKTGLSKKSWADARWFTIIQASDCVVVGFLPLKLTVVILKKYEAFLASQPD